MNRKVLRPDLPIQAAKVLFRKLGAGALNISYKLDCCRYVDTYSRALIKKNAKFKDCFRGKRAFVVGNGPSLARHNLELLKDELVLVSNGFACHPILKSWQPFAITLADPLYFEKWQEFGDEYAKMRSNLDCNYFLPVSGHRCVVENVLLPPDKCHYYFPAGSMAHQSDWDVDLTIPMPAGQNVTHQIISQALYMGCGPIYLIGMDHDFLASPKKATHFSKEYEANLKLDLYPTWSYLKLIEANKLMWEGYYNLKRVASRRGQQVLNASIGGFLDVFPRVNYKELFDSNLPKQ